MAHQVENMFSVRETPWHGLGTVLTDSPDNAHDAAVQGGLAWSVNLRPLFLSDGRQVDSQAVVRSSDSSILGVVGARWTPLQNADAFAWFDPFTKSGQASYTTAGSLCGGRRVWILAELNRRPVEIVSGDAVRKFLLLSNSHDGSLAVSVGFTPIRVVCANTLAMAHGDKASQLIRLRHTRGLAPALDEVRDVINAADACFEATAEQYRTLARRNVANRSDLRDYVQRVLELSNETKTVRSADLAARGGLTAKSADIMAAVLANFDGDGHGANLPGVRGTWWSAYNAVTEYLSYTRGRTADSRLDSLWYGDSAKTNARALELALGMAV